MNTLIIGDPHAPFTKAGYLEHCMWAKEEYSCRRVVCTGDVLDNHYSSFHTADPDGYGAGDELWRAVDMLRTWYYAFPEMYICLGNHDNIPARKAFEAGISERWVRSVPTLMQEEGFEYWKWAPDWDFGGIKYLHGIGGVAHRRMIREGCSIVQGHLHSASNKIAFQVTPHTQHFSLQLGCGIDIKSYAMAYGKHFDKPVIDCAVIIDDYTPIPLTMKM